MKEVESLVFNNSLKYSNIPLNRREIVNLLPEQCDNGTFENLQYIQNNVVRFVQEGRNILIFGRKPMNGKTTWAINILIQYFKDTSSKGLSNHRGVFVSIPSFVQHLKNDINNPNPQFTFFKERIRQAELVVWDDITTNSLSNYSNEVLYTYISERHLHGKANIFTGRYGGDNIFGILSPELTECIKRKGTYGFLISGEGQGNNDFFTNFE